jgi:hypothetical protein
MRIEYKYHMHAPFRNAKMKFSKFIPRELKATKLRYSTQTCLSPKPEFHHIRSQHEQRSTCTDPYKTKVLHNKMPPTCCDWLLLGSIFSLTQLAIEMVMLLLTVLAAF